MMILPCHRGAVRSQDCIKLGRRTGRSSSIILLSLVVTADSQTYLFGGWHITATASVLLGLQPGDWAAASPLGQQTARTGAESAGMCGVKA